MNDAQHAAYSAYLRTLADAMLLRDWEIKIDRDKTTDGAYASVWICDVENLAIVSVGEAFFGYPSEERREWLTHELLHAHLDRPQRILNQLTDQFGDNTACQFAREAHRNEIEICIQRLARILAPLMPLPPEVKA